MRKITLMLMVVCISAVASVAMAADFKPFTVVKDVCPTCPKTATDTITLSNNIKIKAKVVAENTSFLVVQRYGELRTVPRTRITSVSWSGGSKTSNLNNQDQLLLRSGHILTGSIIEEKNKPTGYFRLRSSVNKQTYVIFKAQVAEAYKAGQAYKFSL